MSGPARAEIDPEVSGRLDDDVDVVGDVMKKYGISSGNPWQADLNETRPSRLRQTARILSVPLTLAALWFINEPSPVFAGGPPCPKSQADCPSGYQFAHYKLWLWRLAIGCDYVCVRKAPESSGWDWLTEPGPDGKEGGAWNSHVEIPATLSTQIAAPTMAAEKEQISQSTIMSIPPTSTPPPPTLSATEGVLTDGRNFTIDGEGEWQEDHLFYPIDLPDEGKVKVSWNWLSLHWATPTSTPIPTETSTSTPTQTPTPTETSTTTPTPTETPVPLDERVIEATDRAATAAMPAVPWLKGFGSLVLFLRYGPKILLRALGLDQKRPNT